MENKIRQLLLDDLSEIVILTFSLVVVVQPKKLVRHCYWGYLCKRNSFIGGVMVTVSRGKGFFVVQIYLKQTCFAREYVGCGSCCLSDFQKPVEIYFQTLVIYYELVKVRSRIFWVGNKSLALMFLYQIPFKEPEEDYRVECWRSGCAGKGLGLFGFSSIFQFPVFPM